MASVSATATTYLQTLWLWALRRLNLRAPPPFLLLPMEAIYTVPSCVMFQPNPKNSRPKWCSWLTNEVMLLCGLYEVKNIKENYIEIVDFNE